MPLRVMYYDYDYDDANSKKLDATLKSLGGISYVFMKPDELSLEYPHEEVEKKLPVVDVLLSHPGSSNQKRVTVDYPSQYPKLRIAIVTDFSEYYNPEKLSDSNVEILERDKVDKIIKYLKELMPGD
jgi:hypothetical protein